MSRGSAGAADFSAEVPGQELQRALLRQRGIRR
jgi:hypothetical protein